MSGDPFWGAFLREDRERGSYPFLFKALLRENIREIVFSFLGCFFEGKHREHEPFFCQGTLFGSLFKRFLSFSKDLFKGNRNIGKYWPCLFRGPFWEPC